MPMVVQAASFRAFRVMAALSSRNAVSQSPFCAASSHCEGDAAFWPGKWLAKRVTTITERRGKRPIIERHQWLRLDALPTLYSARQQLHQRLVVNEPPTNSHR